MQDGWFYANGPTEIGPVSFEDLVAALRKYRDPANVQVWRAGFEEWVSVKDVPELTTRVLKPPPLTQVVNADRGPGKIELTDQANSADVTSGRLAFFLVAVVVLGVTATLSTLIYSNSPYGIGYLGGQLLGATAVVAAIAWLIFRRRRSP